MQLTQRSIGVVLALAGTAALVAALRIPCQSPTAVLRQLSTALETGDLQTLLEQACLGAADATAHDIEQRGRTLYDEHIALYTRQQSLGEQQIEQTLVRLRTIEQRLENEGRDAFDDLDNADKWRVWVGLPKEQWLFNVGRAALDAADQAIVTSERTLNDATSRSAAERTVGCNEEGEEAVATLAQVQLGLADPSDRETARVLARCDRAGTATLRRIERAIDRTARSANSGRRRPSAEWAPAAFANEAAEAARLGRAALGASDVSFYDTHLPWRTLQPVARRALAFELGWPQLSAAERAQLGSVSYDAFVAARGEFINREGLRLAAEALRASFGDCRLRVDRLTPIRRTPGGLFGTWAVGVAHTWEPRERRFELYGPELDGAGRGSEAADSPVPADALRMPSDAVVTMAAAYDRGLLRHDYTLVEVSCGAYRVDQLVYHRGRWTAEPVLSAFDRNPMARD